MDDVLGEDVFEMASAEDRPSIEILTTHRSDEALGEGVGPRCLDLGANDPDALRSNDLVEGRGELGISVLDQEPDWVSAVGQNQAQVSGLFDSPRSSWVCCDPCQYTRRMSSSMKKSTSRRFRQSGQPALSSN